MRPASGWIIGYNEDTLTQAGVINIEPNSFWGSFWNSDCGPSADTNGNIYAVTGDGAYFNDWEIWSRRKRIPKRLRLRQFVREAHSHKQ